MSMYRKEWDCCGSVTETDAWEPEECPFCAPIPAGYKLVPVEPTKEMLDEIRLIADFTDNAMKARYAAMLAASQKPQQEGA